MKKIQILTIVVVSVLWLISIPACKKDSQPNDAGEEVGNLIDSIHVNTRVIKAFTDSAYITVYTHNNDSRISWEADHGVLTSLSGSTINVDSVTSLSGTEATSVIYSACEACTGRNTVTCTVVAGDMQQTDTIQILVKSYFD